MRARSLLVAVLALAPFPVIALGATALADHAAKVAARRLDQVARVLLAPPPSEQAWTYVEPEPASLDVFESTDVAKANVAVRGVVPARGVRVCADKVLRLANAGTRPSGIPVPAQGERPAGLALFGVSGLGVGLQDGDVLTHAGGRPARSVADVVGVVIGSRAKHVPEISGRFWRKGQPWNLIVEQPYLQPNRAPVEDEHASAEPGRNHLALSGT